jgi:hypothetical protein
MTTPGQMPDPEPAGNVADADAVREAARRAAEAAPQLIWRCPNMCGFQVMYPANQEVPASVDSHQQSCSPAGAW